ncbi:MAG: bifunctional demethylmenaquinone methyltransferase/2-methoxy-6-polyprenyl-1,4-benzoquinol methylase UbiE [Helicobacteraceae bacterium]|nr:bifunctional demethylmenaquinone methyltransferase/2-methoxy-6-polyprenyl-1,4-benzoquinol methylase UbiE [Helicobacteraceae bacterium]
MSTNKQEKIINMFDEIAPKYDKANRILSLGIDTTWRKEACKRTINLSRSNDKMRILDVACGTGDMILNWLNYKDRLDYIIGIDPSIKMLNIAKTKLPKEIKLIQGEAKNLKIKSNSIDILSIAYGLRNVVELDLALDEFARVLKSGGMLVILEFTKKERENLLDKIALFYTTKILPLLGGAISKNYSAYKYLPNSIKDFLTLEELVSKLSKLNFTLEFKKRYIGNLCTLLIVRKNEQQNDRN